MRILHTMIRVADLSKSIEFYTQALGMSVLRQRDNEAGRYTLAFLGYGPETENTAIELTYNWDTDAYDLGSGFGHIAFEVDDVYATAAAIRAKGYTITREAGPLSGSTSVIAFATDPDGYMIELINKK